MVSMRLEASKSASVMSDASRRTHRKRLKHVAMTHPATTRLDTQNNSVLLFAEAKTYSCFCQLMKRMASNFPHGGAMDTHFANMRSLIQVRSAQCALVQVRTPQCAL